MKSKRSKKGAVANEELILEIDVSANGRLHKPIVRVKDSGGRVLHTDKVDLASDAERNKLAERLANRYNRDPADVKAKLDELSAQAANQQLAQAEVEGSGAVGAGPVGGDKATFYFEHGGTICHNRMTGNGPVSVSLCNFTARIVEEAVHDDGVERRTVLAIEGRLADGTPLPRTEVPAADFDGMGWIVPAWGTRAVRYAGMGTKDHLRAAFQLLSGEVPRRTVFGHLGWREVGGHWHYLHGGGAIGPEGPVEGIEVAPPAALEHYSLPPPPVGDQLTAAIRASLGLLDGLAPDRVAFPLLAAAYRAALDGCDFSMHLAGPTGVFKTELAALAQQHYGPGLDARHLPGSWSSTGNSLEGIAFAAKDALLVVDDFAPGGTAHDVQRYHREADRLLRAQGNRSGRQRMRPDGGLKPAKPPRGLILSTGEDVPRGQSLRARLFVVEVSPGEVDVGRLSACQKDAAAGLYAQAFAGFVRWLAPQYGEVHDRLKAEAAGLRDQTLTEDQHARTPGILADLILGLHYPLQFALSVGAVTEAERVELWRRGVDALAEAAVAQADHVAAAEPAGHFLRLLAAALASGRAHVTDPDGLEPEEPEAWGWRGKEYYTGTGPDDTRENTDWTPQGRRIGWVDGADGAADLYLEPEASYAAAQELARDQGESLAVSQRTLWRRLHERGLLASTDPDRKRLMVRKRLEGVRRYVVHLAAKSLYHPETAPTAPAPKRNHENGAVGGAVDGAVGGQPENKRPRQSAPKPAQSES
jgi:hypothetical protein